MFYRPAKAYLNLPALSHNLTVAKRLAPNSKVLAVIKADGYGHGISRVAQQLSHADGFGVTSIDEALILRQKGFLHRILLLEGLFSKAELPLIIQNHLDLVVHSHYQLEWLLEFTAPFGINVWIKIDTGMHRLGFKPDEVSSIIRKLEASPNTFHPHLMSHLATADEEHSAARCFTQQQITTFEQASAAYDLPTSLLNSAGVQSFSNNSFDWIRPGIMLYGSGQSEGSELKLQAVMQLESKVISIKEVNSGESVGYGNSWIARRDSVIAVIAIGYGDGYPRHAPSGTPVLIKGYRVSLVGRVSMDMITVDITDYVDLIEIGSTAELWGDSLSVDEVAQWAGTISYELLCGITQRVPMIEIQ
jgi:alanine racemase